jgi:ATP-binding cassette subfamily B protein
VRPSPWQLHFATKTNLGGYFLDKLLKLYSDTQHVERQQQKRELGWQLGLNVLSSLVAGVAFVLVVVAAFSGQLSLGDITLYVSTIASVQTGLQQLISAITRLGESSLFYSYYTDLLALPNVLPAATEPVSVTKLSSGIELRHVSFRYDDDYSWVLHDVNLFIPAGQCLALVGLNGAGKTTLVKLLTRLYDPTEGQILWNGMDIRHFEIEAFRQHIGVIFQDYVRYDLTIEENIGLGNVTQLNNLHRIQRAARQADLHEDIKKMPNGYETPLGFMFADRGKGADLSGGQWQKLATARLFMRDEAELLILDEPTAALDARAEFETYQHFTELTDGRTSVLISHRFSTVRMADCIAVLQDGKIAEIGSHEALMARDGHYARLFKLQAEGYQRA